MVAFKNVALFAAAVSAAAVEQRDVNSVLKNLSIVNSDTVKLGTQTKAWDGSLGGAIPIENTESQLEDDITAATKEANGESTLSSTNAKKVVAYVSSTLRPNICSVVTLFISKKSSVSKAGLTGVVHDDLVQLRTDATSLANALIKIASSDQKAAGSSVSKSIISCLSKGVSAYT